MIQSKITDMYYQGKVIMYNRINFGASCFAGIFNVCTCIIMIKVPGNFLLISSLGMRLLYSWKIWWGIKFGGLVVCQNSLLACVCMTILY